MLDARIHAVHIVNVGAASTTPSITLPTTLLELLRSAGQEVIDTITARADDTGVEVTGDVREGFPARVILSYADDHDIDLIAMGQRVGEGSIASSSEAPLKS